MPSVLNDMSLSLKELQTGFPIPLRAKAKMSLGKEEKKMEFKMEGLIGSRPSRPTRTALILKNDLLKGSN